MEQLQRDSLNHKERLYGLFEIVIALLVVLMAVSRLFYGVKILGASMMNTYEDNDRVLAAGYLFTPEVNDIIVFDNQYYIDPVTGKHTHIIKRVIAAGGESIKFELGDDGDTVSLYKLTGETWSKVDEPYIFEPMSRQHSFNRPDGHFTIVFGEAIAVPERQYFVMGDNRNHSSDSRAIGFVPREDVLAEVVMRLSQNTLLNRLIYWYYSPRTAN
ncbi:MAG: signal peptidase I [Clostridiales bacterium]|jgi:signal peptidase I|nr:signal peptidase I [Clostridiales bacterium]